MFSSSTVLVILNVLSFEVKDLQKTKKAFSLAEMMVVMLILSVVLAASVPLMTKRTSAVSGDGVWQYTSNGKDIYYSNDGTHRASIGTKNVPATDSMLTLNTNSSAQNQITFYQSAAKTGALILDSSGNAGFGDVTLAGASGNSTAIGNNASATGAGSVAIGCDSTGTGATTATANQIKLGTANQNVMAPGEIQSTSVGTAQFRAVSGNYGAMIKNDGTDTYVLVTASGSPYGTYTAARPIRIHNADGKCYINGSYPLGDTAHVISTNGYETLSNGLILQWGTETGVPFNQTAVNIDFTIPFPTAVFNVTCTVSYSAIVSGSIGTVVQSKTNAGFVFIGDHSIDTASGSVYWFAIGN